MSTRIIKQALTALVTILGLFMIQQLWLGSAVQSAMQPDPLQSIAVVTAPDYSYQVRSLRASVADLNRRVASLTPVSDQDSGN